MERKEFLHTFPEKKVKEEELHLKLKMWTIQILALHHTYFSPITSTIYSH